MKCNKLNFFHMIFHVLKYYQDENLLFYLYHRNNSKYDF